MLHKTRAMRITKNQLDAYLKDPIEGLVLEHDQTEVLKLNFTLIGPRDTPWEDHIMHGYVKLSDNYPFVPPEVKFITKTLHPNIYKDGKVCLSILNSTQDETGYFQQSELWSPVLDIRCVFLCIMTLFTEPNLESPADLDSCILYRTNIRKLTTDVRKLME